MAQVIKNVKVMSQADGPDPTKLQPSDYNNGLKLAGGSPGQFVGWDATDATYLSKLAYPPGPFSYLINGDLEIWLSGTAAAPNGWSLVGASATVARSGTAKRGSFAAALTRVGTDCYLGQDISTLYGGVNWWKSRAVAFGAWVSCAVASRARLTINDGVGASSSSYHTGSGQYEFLRVSRTIDASASQVQVRLVVDTANTSATFDGVALIAADGVGDFSPGASDLPQVHGQPLYWSLLATESAAIANTAAETGFNRAVSIPTRYLNQAGATIRLTAAGRISTAAAAPTLRIKVRIGGNVFCEVFDSAVTANLVNNGWGITAEFKIRTPGSSGVSLKGRGAGGVGNRSEFSNNQRGTFTLNTTIDQTLDVTITWGTASASNSIVLETANVEILYPAIMD